MPVKIDAKELWIKKLPVKRIEDKKYWAELRIKKDKKTKVDYIDVIFALKHHNPHIHVGRKLNGELLFAESRDELQSSRDEVNSKLHGKLLDDVIILKTTSPKMPLEIKIDYSGKTKEVTITGFKFKRS